MTLRLRAETFDAMLRQEIGWFDDKANATGSLCARLSGEASAVQGVLLIPYYISNINCQEIVTPKKSFLEKNVVLTMYYD